jgi:hypothetical protein
MLGLTTVPDELLLGGSATATATLRFNSDAEETVGEGWIMDGTPVAFGATGGEVVPETTGTLTGNAATVFTATAVGSQQVSAAVDGETVSNQVTVTAEADLGITIVPLRQGVEGGSVAAFEVTVTNAGPLAVTEAGVAVEFAASFSDVSWTCSGVDGGVCSAEGVGDISDLVELPVGGSVVYVAAATTPDPMNGLLEVLGQVTPPAEYIDPDTSNNTVTAVVGEAGLLEDGFESGTTSAWSGTVSGGT